MGETMLVVLINNEYEDREKQMLMELLAHSVSEKLNQTNTIPNFSVDHYSLYKLRTVD